MPAASPISPSQFDAESWTRKPPRRAISFFLFLPVHASEQQTSILISSGVLLPSYRVCSWFLLISFFFLPFSHSFAHAVSLLRAPSFSHAYTFSLAIPPPLSCPLERGNYTKRLPSRVTNPEYYQFVDQIASPWFCAEIRHVVSRNSSCFALKLSLVLCFQTT